MRLLVGLILGLIAGAASVTYYWWRSDQQQAEALDGWEWTERPSRAEELRPV